jgi:hypothetical protein
VRSAVKDFGFEAKPSSPAKIMAYFASKHERSF